MKLETILNAYAFAVKKYILTDEERRGRQVIIFKRRILKMFEEKDEEIHHWKCHALLKVEE